MKYLKIRRIIASYIDYLIVFYGLYFLVNFIFSLDIANNLKEQLVFVFIIIFSLIFISKDIIFKNTSLGKKICKLGIFDLNGKAVVSKKTLIKRNIINCISFPIYIFQILINNKSLGDYKYNTVVYPVDNNKYNMIALFIILIVFRLLLQAFYIETNLSFDTFDLNLKDGCQIITTYEKENLSSKISEIYNIYKCDDFVEINNLIKDDFSLLENHHEINNLLASVNLNVEDEYKFNSENKYMYYYKGDINKIYLVYTEEKNILYTIEINKMR